MTLNKIELIGKLIAGEKLRPKGATNPEYCMYNENYSNPFRCVNEDENTNEDMDGMWDIGDWEVYNPKSVLWEPKDDEEAYCLHPDGTIQLSSNWKSNISKNCITQGNVFKTKEEAKTESKLRTAKYRVKKRIWELNGGMFVEFNPKDYNHSFEYDPTQKELFADAWKTIKFHSSWQYLKSKELVEQLIEDMHNDLLLIRSE